MNNFLNLLWVEARKAIRSRMPLWTALGSLFMPLGIAFLIFIAKNPEISQNLGLVGAKANLVAFSAVDWKTYLETSAQMIAVGEATGALDTMLAKIADFYEEEVDAAVAGLLTLLEPLMMAVLGGIVGGIVIAMYMPIFALISKLA